LALQIVGRYNQANKKEIRVCFVLYRWINSQTVDGREWLLRRNCMLTPTQLASFMAMAGLLSLCVAIAWGLAGVWWVLPFALIEIAGLSIAFFVYSRHATDLDRVIVGEEKVVVEVVDGSKRSRSECPNERVRIAYSQGKKSLIQLRLGSNDWHIGRFVPESQREALAKEIAKALGVTLQPIRV
jgi:uncharacterized membrane protein